MSLLVSLTQLLIINVLSQSCKYGEFQSVNTQCKFDCEYKDEQYLSPSQLTFDQIKQSCISVRAANEYYPSKCNSVGDLVWPTICKCPYCRADTENKESDVFESIAYINKKCTECRKTKPPSDYGISQPVYQCDDSVELYEWSLPSEWHEYTCPIGKCDYDGKDRPAGSVWFDDVASEHEKCEALCTCNGVMEYSTCLVGFKNIMSTEKFANALKFLCWHEMIDCMNEPSRLFTDETGPVCGDKDCPQCDCGNHVLYEKWYTRYTDPWSYEDKCVQCTCRLNDHGSKYADCDAIDDDYFALGSDCLWETVNFQTKQCHLGSSGGRSVGPLNSKECRNWYYGQLQLKTEDITWCSWIYEAGDDYKWGCDDENGLYFFCEAFGIPDECVYYDTMIKESNCDGSTSTRQLSGAQYCCNTDNCNRQSVPTNILTECTRSKGYENLMKNLFECLGDYSDPFIRDSSCNKPLSSGQSITCNGVERYYGHQHSCWCDFYQTIYNKVGSQSKAKIQATIDDIASSASHLNAIFDCDIHLKCNLFEVDMPMNTTVPTEEPTTPSPTPKPVKVPTFKPKVPTSEAILALAPLVGALGGGLGAGVAALLATLLPTNREVDEDGTFVPIVFNEICADCTCAGDLSFEYIKAACPDIKAVADLYPSSCNSLDDLIWTESCDQCPFCKCSDNGDHEVLDITKYIAKECWQCMCMSPTSSSGITQSVYQCNKLHEIDDLSEYWLWNEWQCPPVVCSHSGVSNKPGSVWYDDANEETVTCDTLCRCVDIEEGRVCLQGWDAITKDTVFSTVLQAKCWDSLIDCWDEPYRIFTDDVTSTCSATLSENTCPKCRCPSSDESWYIEYQDPISEKQICVECRCIDGEYVDCIGDEYHYYPPMEDEECLEIANLKYETIKCHNQESRGYDASGSVGSLNSADCQLWYYGDSSPEDDIAFCKMGYYGDQNTYYWGCDGNQGISFCEAFGIDGGCIYYDTNITIASCENDGKRETQRLYGIEYCCSSDNCNRQNIESAPESCTRSEEYEQWIQTLYQCLYDYSDPIIADALCDKPIDGEQGFSCDDIETIYSHQVSCLCQSYQTLYDAVGSVTKPKIQAMCDELLSVGSNGVCDINISCELARTRTILEYLSDPSLTPKLIASVLVVVVLIIVFVVLMRCHRKKGQSVKLIDGLHSTMNSKYSTFREKSVNSTSVQLGDKDPMIN